MKNMAKLSWEGIFPALTTKFLQDESLDLVSFGANLEAQIEAGVHGVILGGTLGESAVLTREEKKTLLKVSVEMCQGRVPVIMNIAEARTAEGIRAIKEAENEGASGFMLLPPMRYKASEKEIADYILDLAKSTSLPVMLYNNPVDYKNEITLDMFQQFRNQENIQAVKESTRDVGNITRMINRFGDRYTLLCGVDTLAFEGILLGAKGWVAGLVCAFPKETMALYQALKNGEIEKARNLNRWFFPLFELDIHPKLVQYIKLAESMTGLGTEFVRKPRLPLEGTEREEIVEILENAIKNNPLK